MHRLSTSSTLVATPATLPLAPTVCAWCMGQRAIWEPSPLGLLPVVCGGCAGTGYDGGPDHPSRAE